VKVVWVVALKGGGNASVLGGKSSRAKAGEPNDSFCTFSSRGAAKRFVRIGQEQFDFLSSALRGDPAEEVEYYPLRPDTVTTFAKDLGLSYVMPNPTPQLFFRDGVVITVPVVDFADSL
jgi:hypothetical protein